MPNCTVDCTCILEARGSRHARLSPVALRRDGKSPTFFQAVMEPQLKNMLTQARSLPIPSFPSLPPPFDLFKVSEAMRASQFGRRPLPPTWSTQLGAPPGALHLTYILAYI